VRSDCWCRYVDIGGIVDNHCFSFLVILELVVLYRFGMHRIALSIYIFQAQ